MKRRRSQQAKDMRTLRLWSYDEAHRAVPYLRAVIASLREHWLDVQNQRRRSELLSARPGRPDKATLLASQTVHAHQERAEAHFDDAVEELTNMDVFLLDPLRGTALIPFRKKDDLAWYVYDQFDDRGLSGWRYHSDPLEQCRPLELQESVS